MGKLMEYLLHPENAAKVPERKYPVRNWKFALLALLLLLGLTRLFTTTNVMSIVAEVFCISAVIIFAAAALFGLATKLRA